MFDTIIFEPLLNTLLFLHRYLPGQDMGLAIIALTLLIKLVLYVPSLSSIRASRQLQTLQPRMRELQEKYKNDRETLAREQMKLYKDSKVNPLSSCLPILIQLPILFGLYQVFISGVTVNDQGLLATDRLEHLYASLRDFYASTPLNTMFLNFVDMAKNHNVIIALLAGASQFWQTRMLAAPKEPNVPGAKDEAMASAMTKQMQYIFPLVTLYISYTLPAGLGLYWLVSTAFTIVQQYIFLRSHPVKPATSPTNGQAA